MCVEKTSHGCRRARRLDTGGAPPVPRLPLPSPHRCSCPHPHRCAAPRYRAATWVCPEIRSPHSCTCGVETHTSGVPDEWESFSTHVVWESVIYNLEKPTSSNVFFYLSRGNLTPCSSWITRSEFFTCICIRKSLQHGCFFGVWPMPMHLLGPAVKVTQNGKKHDYDRIVESA